MQNSMNGNKPLFVMIPVPMEVLEESGIDIGDLVHFIAADGIVVMEAVTDLSDFVCDGDCDNCPVDQIECNYDCDHCPCSGDCDESEGQ